MQSISSAVKGTIIIINNNIVFYKTTMFFFILCLLKFYQYFSSPVQYTIWASQYIILRMQNTGGNRV